MDGLIVMVLGLGGFFTLMLLLPLLGSLTGAFVGWVVSMTFLSSWVTSGLAILGFTVAGSQLYQVGAALGFIGAFFKANNSNTNNVEKD